MLYSIIYGGSKMENKKSEIEARRKEMLKQITKKHDEIYKEKTTK